MSQTTANPYQAPTGWKDDGAPPGETCPPHYLSFQGRVDRMRFLGYTSLTYLQLFMLALIGNVLLQNSNLHLTAQYAHIFINLGGIYVLPMLANLVFTRRRLQDLDQSPWLGLLTLVPVAGILFALYLTLMPGTSGSNDAGPPMAGGRAVVLWLVPALLGTLLWLLSTFGLAMMVVGEFAPGYLR